jgi:hypothetical protein
MPTVAIVSEGADDVSALRALLRADGWTVSGVISGASRNPMTAVRDSRSVAIWTGAKPDELATRAIDASKVASDRANVVVVCFDPDADPAATDFQFFLDSFEKVRGQRAGPLSSMPSFRRRK